MNSPPIGSRSISHPTRLVGAVLALGAIALAARLVWEMTLLTWREGTQMVGFALAHLAPQLLVLGSVCRLGAAVWSICVGVAAITRRRKLLALDWLLLVVCLLPISATLVPYSAWQWATVQMLGTPPLPRNAGDILCRAAANGDIEVLSNLLTRGLDANSVDYRGHTALFSASERGHVRAISIPIQHHASINHQGTDGLTALHIAAQNGQIEAVKLLLAGGADRRIRTDPHGFSAADLAWSANHPEIVNLLE